MRPVAKLAFALFVVTALPSTALAKPNLTGTWSIVGYSPSIKTVDGKSPPLRPEAKAIYEDHLAAAGRGERSWDKTNICLPPGLPRLMLANEPFEILQRDKAVYFLHQLNRLPHRAYFNEALPTDADPLYLGYSIARWDGDTLVVESSGFRDGTLLDDKGLPHSEALHLTERYQLDERGRRLKVDFTIDDPKSYTRPWTAHATYTKKPDNFRLPEEVCLDKRLSTAPKRR
jgi:hypothetical protein